MLQNPAMFLHFSGVVSCIVLASAMVDSTLPLFSCEADHCQVNNSCLESADGSAVCPAWFVCGSNNTCECGSSHDYIIKCNELSQIAMVLDCYCITYDEDTNETFAGACFVNCANNYAVIYRQVEQNRSRLNSQMCGETRAGTLCGKCKDEYYPKAYSYDRTCMPCENDNKNWGYFFLAACGPLTLFYFFVLLVKLNVTSSHLHGFIFISQTITIPKLVQVLIAGVQPNPVMVNIVKALVTLLGIWNLDFFRAYMTGICLRVGTLHVLALEYTVAAYPFVLTLISYFMIELYDRNIRILVLLWKPFRHVLMLFRRNWNVRTSLVDAYSTFLMLSYMKFLSVSFNLLVPTVVYKLGSNDTSLALYYNANEPYFGKSHLPFAILALFVFLIFNLLPMLVMFLYQFRWFQTFLFCLPIKHHILDTFMDTFQGCFKDGMEPGTRDCRWFSAVYLFMRVLGFLTFAFSPTVMFFTFLSIWILIFMMVLVIVQPYKSDFAHYMPVNIIFFLILALLLTSIAGTNTAAIKDRRSVVACVGLAFLFTIIMLLLISVHALQWFFARRQFGIEFVSRLRALRQGYMWWANSSAIEDSLPDRLQNPHHYQDRSLNSFDTTTATE